MTTTSHPGSAESSESTITSVNIERPTYPRSTRVLLRDKIATHGWEIGEHTYGTFRVEEPSIAPLRIGRFCSIAASVTFILGNHRIDTVSTYPFRTLRRYWPNADTRVPDHATNGGITVGNDVWIGLGATIMSGVEIGDGAVVAAGAVVTRNVEPYSIVAGVPASTLRRRFSDEIVDALLAIRWWDWPDERIDQNLPLMSRDIDGFIRAHLPVATASPERIEHAWWRIRRR